MKDNRKQIKEQVKFCSELMKRLELSKEIQAFVLYQKVV